MRVHINKLTKEKVREMLIQADDSVANQWRVDKQGYAFISQVVGAEQIGNIQLRFETTDAGNEYVGQSAANDDNYVSGLYEDLINFWKHGYSGYLDYHFSAVSHAHKD